MYPYACEINKLRYVDIIRNMHNALVLHSAIHHRVYVCTIIILEYSLPSRGKRDPETEAQPCLIFGLTLCLDHA